MNGPMNLMIILDRIINGDHESILKYKELGDLARLAVPTPDHFYPLLYTLGASYEGDKVSVYNKFGDLGSITMTSYLWE